MSEIMSFPRISEIIDSVAQSLIQPDDEDPFQDTVKDITNFRLVCKDFAAGGIRYLVPVVSLMAVPEALEIPNKIAEHPVMRYYVTKFIYYCDTINGKDRLSYQIIDKAYPMDESRPYRNILRNIKRLISAFPRIQHVEIRSLVDDACRNRWHGFSVRKYGRIRSRYGLGTCDHPYLEFLNVLGDIDTLVLSRVSHAPHICNSPGFLRSLRKLVVVPLSTKASELATVLNSLPALEELQCTRIPYWYEPTETLKTLPQTLKSLRLEHIDFSGKSFPTKLHTLTLCEMTLEVDALPQSLSSINFANLRLLDSTQSRWVDILLGLETGCIFKIAGYLTSRTESGCERYLQCRDLVWNNRVGEILSNLLSSTVIDSSSRGELLGALFEEHGRVSFSGQDNAPSWPYRDLRSSPSFKDRYQEIMDSLSTSSIVIAGPRDRDLCKRCYTYYYSGIVR